MNEENANMVGDINLYDLFNTLFFDLHSIGQAEYIGGHLMDFMATFITMLLPIVLMYSVYKIIIKEEPPMRTLAGGLAIFTITYMLFFLKSPQTIRETDSGKEYKGYLLLYTAKSILHAGQVGADVLANKILFGDEWETFNLKTLFINKDNKIRRGAKLDEPVDGAIFNMSYNRLHQLKDSESILLYKQKHKIEKTIKRLENAKDFVAQISMDDIENEVIRDISVVLPIGGEVYYKDEGAEKFSDKTVLIRKHREIIHEKSGAVQNEDIVLDYSVPSKNLTVNDVYDLVNRELKIEYRYYTIGLIIIENIKKSAKLAISQVKLFTDSEEEQKRKIEQIESIKNEYISKIEKDREHREKEVENFKKMYGDKLIFAEQMGYMTTNNDEVNKMIDKLKWGVTYNILIEYKNFADELARKMGAGRYVTYPDKTRASLYQILQNQNYDNARVYIQKSSEYKNLYKTIEKLRKADNNKNILSKMEQAYVAGNSYLSNITLGDLITAGVAKEVSPKFEFHWIDLGLLFSGVKAQLDNSMRLLAYQSQKRYEYEYLKNVNRMFEKGDISGFENKNVAMQDDMVEVASAIASVNGATSGFTKGAQGALTAQKLSKGKAAKGMFYKVIAKVRLLSKHSFAVALLSGSVFAIGSLLVSSFVFMIVLYIINIVLPVFFWTIGVINWFVRSSFLLITLPVSAALIVFKSKRDIFITNIMKIVGQALVPVVLVASFFIIIQASITINYGLKEMVPILDSQKVVAWYAPEIESIAKQWRKDLFDSEAGEKSFSNEVVEFFGDGADATIELFVDLISDIVTFIINSIYIIIITIMDIMLLRYFWRADDFIAEFIGTSVRNDVFNADSMLSRFGANKLASAT